jgi:integrase
VKPETASRVRARVESILAYAQTQGWRAEGPNPAAWRAHLENLLPARAKVAAVVHHRALPWREIAEFMRELRMQGSVPAMALEFAVLTAARSGEVLRATWSEIDHEHAVWTVPSARTKAGREHRVPLSPAAQTVLETVAPLRNGRNLLFPGRTSASGGLHKLALFELIRRMGRSDLTAHGFRSTFADWAAETGQPGDLREAALAHALGSKVAVAYQRGDLLDRRRRLMSDWADWCSRAAVPADAVQSASVTRAK